MKALRDEKKNGMRVSATGVREWRNHRRGGGLNKNGRGKKSTDKDSGTIEKKAGSPTGIRVTCIGGGGKDEGN